MRSRKVDISFVSMMRIPEELVALAAERRLIPFVGAGFSASLGLPTWEEMLRSVCAGLEDAIDFDELLTATNNDLLQVAEYLFLKHDRQIGPIRHQIEKSFSSASPKPLSSGAHVELVNLGAAQIYTTNYDDIIEQTYRALGLPVNAVILPKDVALAHSDRTQVVKYHGDLAHDRTLVLTESAYYKRLDFESPMDLKFRSDLLGKSVLFMGYSFRDINIRIIWFKLMEMMRDIPEADRHPSYIVRIGSNPALEDLYSAVGLTTVVLDPDGDADTPEKRTALVGNFLMTLSARAATRALKGGSEAKPVYVSQTVLDRGAQLVESFGEYESGRRFGTGYLPMSDATVSRLFTGIVPSPLLLQWEKVTTALLPFSDDDDKIALLRRLPASPTLTAVVVMDLSQQGSEDRRASKRLLASDQEIWQKVWSNTVKPELAQTILESFAAEIRYQADEGADEDIAHLAELAKRISVGMLIDEGKTPEAKETVKVLRERASILLGLAAQIYPGVKALAPSAEAAPQVTQILKEVSKRAEKFKPVSIDSSDLPRRYSPIIRRSMHMPN